MLQKKRQTFGQVLLGRGLATVSRVSLFATAALLVAVTGMPMSRLLADNSGNGYRMSGVLGQTSLDGQPSFTSSYYNNQIVPNDKGLAFPSATLVDEANHLLFVAENSNARVVVFQLDGNNNLIDHTADFVIGQKDFTSRDAPANGTTLTAPSGLAYDTERQFLFVADQQANRVMIFNLSNGVSNGMNAMAVLGQANFTDSGAHRSQTGMSRPGALAYDSTTKALFVNDVGHLRTLIFNLSGNIFNGQPANYLLGQHVFDNQTAGVGQRSDLFTRIKGLAYDPDTKRLFVGDHTRIMIFDLGKGISNGMSASNILGEPDFTTTTQGSVTDTTIRSATGITYDKSRKMLAAQDSSLQRILFYDLSAGLTNNMPATKVLGQPDFTSSEQRPASARDLYVCEPAGLSFDGTGNLWTADSCNNRVLRFNTSGITNYMPANEVVGQLDHNNQPSFTKNTENNTLLTGNGFTEPYATALDPVNHRLFVADRQNQRVLVFKLNDDNSLASTTATHVLGQPNFSTKKHSAEDSWSMTNMVRDLAFDPVNNRLFVAQASTKGYSMVTVFDFKNGITNNMDAAYVIGQPAVPVPDFDSAPSQTRISYVQGIDFDPVTQSLFVVDASNNRILLFNLSNGIINGMPADRVIGQSDFSSSNWPDSNTIQIPIAVKYDPRDKRLFASDSSCRVLVYDFSGGATNGMPASYVIGQTSGFDPSGYECTANKNHLSYVEGIDYDSSRQLLYAVSSWQGKVTVFDLSKGISNGMDGVAALGQPELATDDYSQTNPSAYRLTFARGVELDPTGRRVFVIDSNANRVVQYDVVTLLPLPFNQLREGEERQITLSAYGQGTLSFKLMEGELPPGIVLDEQTGRLSGTVTTKGSYTFTIKVIDDNGGAGIFTDTRTYTLNVVGEEDPVVPPIVNGYQQAAGPTGNPIYRTFVTANNPAPSTSEQATPDNSCLKVVNLDEQESYTNGDGYEVEVDNCYVNYFSTVDDNGQEAVFGLAVNYVDDYIVNVTLAQKETFNRPIASGDLLPNQPPTLFQPSKKSPFALAAAVTDLPKGVPTATLKLAKAAPVAETAQSNILNWLLALFITSVAAATIYFAWHRRSQTVTTDPKGEN